MESLKQPLSVVFVWHPANDKIIKSTVEYCSAFLFRDIENPFSRGVDIPVFYRTSIKKGVPAKIQSNAEKTFAFIFISEELIADDDWNDYLKEISDTAGLILVPVALDKNAYKCGGELSKVNFIRAYEFSNTFFKEFLFISIMHEIYRYALNENFDINETGKYNALKIFLSHSKSDNNGIKLTTALKNFIDNSGIQNFFDATDIATGYKFDNEIEKNIKKSSVVAIQSDTYSSRYWCQREILCAKMNNRPIVVVDSLKEFEDRRFPYSSNVPVVHVNLQDTPEINDILRILSATLLETVRFLYFKKQFDQFMKAGWIDSNAICCCRPPEIFDFIQSPDEKQLLIYPEPPLYHEEQEIFNIRGIKIQTLLNFGFDCKLDKNIGISISEISEEELAEIGQGKMHLKQISQDLARYILASGATLIYGGDLRPDGFTEFILNEAQVIQTRLNTSIKHVKNYSAYPIYNQDSSIFRKWKVENSQIADMIKVNPPDDVINLISDKEGFLLPVNSQNWYVRSLCLSKMRKEMISDCDIRICAGGKFSGYKGCMPGVLEELIIAIRLKKPTYILGGFGGVTGVFASCFCKQKFLEN